jgi:Putative peptidoglycan binding domain
VRASRRALAIGAALATLVFGGGALLYASDARRNDEIANGVRVAGVDIGGLRADAARAKLAHDLAPRSLGQSSSEAAHERGSCDLGGRGFASISRRPSRKHSSGAARDSIFVRTARAVVGSALHANIGPRVSYSKQAVKQFIEDIRRGVDRPARDATVRPLVTRLEKVPARDGFSVKAALLRRKVGLALSGRTAGRTILVPKRRLRPKVRLTDLT